MALIQPARPEPEQPDEPGGRGRKLARYGVPVAVAGVAAATIGLVPALADAGDPSLPSVTAEQLLTKIAASQTRTVDGTVKVTTDLGLPDLSGGSALLGGLGTPGSGGSGDSPAAPQSQLTQLLTGSHQLHVAADGPDRQKISIIEPAAEYSLIRNGTQLWAYDSGSDQAYHATLPAPSQQHEGLGGAADGVPTTPQAAAEQVLKAADGTSRITVDGTARVAGRSAYELVVTPEHATDTTVGAIRIAVDSATGVPLKFTLTPKGGGKAVFDIGFTRVDFGTPAAGTFTFTPPKGVKVTEGSTPSRAASPAPQGAAPTVLGKGWDTIAVIDTSALNKGAGKGADGGFAGFGAQGKDKPARGSGDSGSGDVSALLNGFGSKVSGSFGTGTAVHTRLVNALLTDKGTLYVGAVTQSALVQAADAAK
ncbi:LolA family protein [Actinacidiphila guanduensis]|uniref:Outer membrane lipoprotein carrier protein LolA n=1 Tax=Actinacidiphila guanduensis TaxID=310781 RepID=A0A1H0IS69_9ACTN|nr:DUF2092 domain-containing protein [Actinacidiphila guanduensis]SDO34304.1 hypothetical protein SAMN05216259_10993 [Actinacidiphila guanduensis]